MGRQPPATDPNASTLLTKLGATADRSRAGLVALSLDGVTVEVSTERMSPTVAEARAVYDLTNTLSRDAPTDTKRTSYAGMVKLALTEWKVLGYTDLAKTDADKRIAKKLAYWTGQRDAERQAAK